MQCGGGLPSRARLNVLTPLHPTMLHHLALLIFAAQDPSAGAPVLSTTDWILPDSGAALREWRLLDPQSGVIRSEGQLLGARVDAQSLRLAAQRAAVDARRGISRDLAEVLATTAPQTVIEVAFWLRSAQEEDWRAHMEASLSAGLGVEDARRNAFAQATATFAPLNAAFAERLAAAGFELRLVADGWPNVCARLPAGAVAEWAADPAVDQAYWAAPEHFTELDDAQATMRTAVAWNRGISASGGAVKVMINDVGDVVSNNPYLPPVIYLTNIGVSSHSTACAGNVAMNHPSFKGAAFGLPQIYSGGGADDASTPPVWSAAISAGVSFGNCSWWTGQKGSIAYLDRFFDYTLRQYGVMMFKSNGNQGGSSTPYATTPGNGYNMICTGAYNDANDANWANDAMASYSSYWDPVEGHEKPELASPGDGVDTATTSNPWIYYGFNGTSSASPLTCGVATLMAARDPSLAGRPEVVKGMLMASAWHNVEGSALLSEYDGAGSVHAGAADSALRDGQYAYVTLTPSSFTNNVYDVSFTAYAGDETRVIGLWFSKANSAYSTDLLDMDLDASVLGPNQAVLTSSANTKNPYELLSFTPTQSGTHTLRLSKIRFNGTSERLCVAWSSRLDMAQATVTASGNLVPGGFVNLTFSDPFDGNVSYQSHLSTGTLPDVAPIGTGWVLALKANNLFYNSGAFSGFSGTLNAAGVATAVGNIPNNPSLSGRVFRVAMYTQAGGQVRAISDPTPLAIQ